MIEGMDKYYLWAKKLGVMIPKASSGEAREIEHPDGTKGTISTEILADAALMSIQGRSDRSIREFLFDNTVFKR